MSEEVPQWAKERAKDELAKSCREPMHHVLARVIARHEQPPVDPDVIAVRGIIAAGGPMLSVYRPDQCIAGHLDNNPHFQAALTVFRKHKEAGK